MIPRYIVLFVISVSFISCATKNRLQVVHDIQIGDPIPCKAEANEMVFTSASSWAGMCSLQQSSITYDLYTEDQKTISRISTHDSHFHTPEGIAVGATLKEVLAKGGKKAGCQPGWSCGSKLPSGWVAVFPPLIYDSSLPSQDPTESSIVIELYKE